jgi:hypothetical protein
VLFFYDAIKAHKIEEISLLFFVYNFEYYSCCASRRVRAQVGRRFLPESLHLAEYKMGVVWPLATFAQGLKESLANPEREREGGERFRRHETRTRINTEGSVLTSGASPCGEKGFCGLSCRDLLKICLGNCSPEQFCHHIFAPGYGRTL